MKKLNKVVIIINGKPESGKDTLCKFASNHYKIKNISAIDPIKTIARRYGDWNGRKDNKSRKFLSDLKQLFVEYNNLPFKYIWSEYESFLTDDNEILFVHIREISEIEKFKNQLTCPCYTLLIVKDSNKDKCFGNVSDDNVENYVYDLMYENNFHLDETEQCFINFLQINVMQHIENY